MGRSADGDGDGHMVFASKALPSLQRSKTNQLGDAIGSQGVGKRPRAMNPHPAFWSANKGLNSRGKRSLGTILISFSPGRSPFFDPGRRRTMGSRWLRNAWVRRVRQRLWRRLPMWVRKPLIQLLFSQGGERLAMDAPAVQPVCIAGYLSTASGIGEGARLSGRALAELGYDVLAVDVSELADQGQTPSDHIPLLEIGPGTMILHFNPDNLSGILSVMGRRRLKRKRIIGYWAWETHRIPNHWLSAFEEVEDRKSVV